MTAPVFVRDSFFGRVVYHLSGKKVFTHPEEQVDYILPEKYLHRSTRLIKEDKLTDSEPPRESTIELEKEDGNIIVDWEGPDDPENPKNWPFYKKVLFILQVGLLTTSIYIGSSVYIPGVLAIVEEFNVSLTVAYLPLSLFIVGYGIGPMVFSPLSEHPAVGRVYIYIVTLFIFVILQIPTAMAKNIASLLVLRFLAGVFASPALATGAASVGDVITKPRIPQGLAIWGISAVCGPTLGPLIGGALAQEVSWRWTFWFLLILNGFCLVVLFFFFPESSEATLLYRKAKRLQKRAQNPKIISEGHIKISEMNPSEVAIDTLYRPIEISFREPVVFLVNVYISLIYAVMYLWFEAFPLVFVDIHGFNTVENGVGYISIMIGILIGCAGYLPALKWSYIDPMERGEKVPPEVFLPTTIAGAIFQPIGIFIFAWASTPSAHWIGPLVGSTIYGSAAFVSFQCLFNYLAFSFPRFQASVFAGNGLFRALLAAAFPLFAKALYTNTGSENYPVGWGCSILGFASVAMISIPVIFYRNGEKIRASSKYAN